MGIHSTLAAFTTFCGGVPGFGGYGKYPKSHDTHDRLELKGMNEF